MWGQAHEAVLIQGGKDGRWRTQGRLLWKTDTWAETWMMRPATEDLKNKHPGEGRCKGSSERTAHHLAGTEVQCSGRAVRARLIPICTCLIYHPHALQKNSQLQAPPRQRWSPQEGVSPEIQKEESWCHYSDYLCQCQGDNSRAPCSCLSC